MKYFKAARKIPFDLDVLLYDSLDDIDEIKSFVNYRNDYPIIEDLKSGCLKIKCSDIHTKDDFKYAYPGDYIIKERGYVVDVVSNDVFNKEYDFYNEDFINEG